MNILLIGCGNIGALYDIDNADIKTHAKALTYIKNISVSVYDEKILLSERTAKKYNYSLIYNREDINLAEFQWVIIASSTSSHFQWMKECFNKKVPLIICEKPLTLNIEELEELEELYNNNESKVLINYIRRFQPAFKFLKNYIETTVAQPTKIVVKYQRGFINNFSHAADLLNYFWEFGQFKNIKILDKVYDEFKEDPTISFYGIYNEVPIIAIGLNHSKFSYFEMEIFYQKEMIHIFNSGDNISVKRAIGNQNFYPMLNEIVLEDANILHNYMSQVYDYSNNVREFTEKDNFASAINTTKQLLSINNIINESISH